MSDSFEHHGVKGQKWGVRRTAEQLGHKISSIKDDRKQKKMASKTDHAFLDDPKSKYHVDKIDTEENAHKALLGIEHYARACRMEEIDLLVSSYEAYKREPTQEGQYRKREEFFERASHAKEVMPGLQILEQNANKAASTGDKIFLEEWNKAKTQHLEQYDDYVSQGKPQGYKFNPPYNTDYAHYFGDRDESDATYLMDTEFSGYVLDRTVERMNATNKTVKHSERGGGEYMSDSFEHHGVKGQKWGVRRTAEQLGHKTSTTAKKTAKKAASAAKKISARAKAKSKKLYAEHKEKAAERKANRDVSKEIKDKRSIKSMSNDELKTRIERLKLENEYKAQLEKLEPKKQEDWKVQLAKDCIKSYAKKSAETLGGNFDYNPITRAIKSNTDAKDKKEADDAAEDARKAQQKAERKVEQAREKAERKTAKAQERAAKAQAAAARAKEAAAHAQEAAYNARSEYAAKRKAKSTIIEGEYTERDVVDETIKLLSNRDKEDNK